MCARAQAKKAQEAELAALFNEALAGGPKKVRIKRRVWKHACGEYLIGLPLDDRSASNLALVAKVKCMTEYIP